VKLLNLLFSIILLIALAKPGLARMMSFDPEMTIFDFEYITNLFKKPHIQTVHILNSPDSPIVIRNVEVSDKGTRRFKDLKDGVDDYQIKVENVSGRAILAYEVTWTLKHPFEDYTFKKITANSTDQLAAGKLQKLEFRRDKYFRDDAYYYVEITKVEFDDDESIWEAPEHEEIYTKFDAIKKEIDALEEKGIDDMSTEELLESTGATLINGSTANDSTTVE